MGRPDVAANVRAELARKHKTRKDLANQLRVGRQAVARRLNGHVAFDVDELHEIAQFLGVSIADLLGEAKASA
jgi:transcriptional regulator with XRE-family HTH domain